GGAGADRLEGGAGADVFVLASAPSTGVDTIVDMTANVDTIRLDSSVFTGLSAGALGASAFHIGAAAADAADRVIYDAGSGALWYDADGSGAGAAVQIAALSSGLGLDAADFFVL
ncbi:calcium-binding protein, partial [Salipiger aestuarii]